MDDKVDDKILDLYFYNEMRRHAIARRDHFIVELRKNKMIKNAFSKVDNYTWIIEDFNELDNEFKHLLGLFPGDMIQSREKRIRRFTFLNGSTIKVDTIVRFNIVVI